MSDPSARVQLEHRVSQRIGDTEAGERRSDGAQNDLFGIIARDDEASDEHLILCQHFHPRGDVQRLGRWVGSESLRRPSTCRPLHQSHEVGKIVKRSRVRKVWENVNPIVDPGVEHPGRFAGVPEVTL